MVDNQLQALRAAGLAEHDPVRFRYLEVLADRWATATGPVQARLAQAFDAAARTQPSAPQARQHALPTKSHACAALRQLNADIAARTGSDNVPSASETHGPARELASVRRFGETWSKVASEQQLLAALENAPANAGPLNSQRLMVQTLQRMHRLSDHYLHRFLAHANALIALEDAAHSLPQAASRASRARRRKN